MCVDRAHAPRARRVHRPGVLLREKKQPKVASPRSAREARPSLDDEETLALTRSAREARSSRDDEETGSIPVLRIRVVGGAAIRGAVSVPSGLVVAEIPAPRRTDGSILR